jgi:hypothetical protein
MRSRCKFGVVKLSQYKRTNMRLRVCTLGDLGLEQAEKAHSLRVELGIDEGGERESAIDTNALGREVLSF